MAERATGQYDILNIIKSRRSVTNYLEKPVPWEYVSRIIDAGRHAPSCGNLQNWKFIVVTEPSRRKALAEAAMQQYWMISAPLHIVVCGEPEKAERYYGVRGERFYTVQNCAAATENILLEAHALGLGACWIAAFDEEAVKEAIGAEEFVRPQSIVTIGFASETPEKPPKMPLESVLYLEKWRSKIRDPAKYFHDLVAIRQREFEKGREAVKKGIGSINKLFHRKEAEESEEAGDEEPESRHPENP